MGSSSPIKGTIPRGASNSRSGAGATCGLQGTCHPEPPQIQNWKPLESTLFLKVYGEAINVACGSFMFFCIFSYTFAIFRYFPKLFGDEKQDHPGGWPPLSRRGLLHFAFV